MSAVPPARPEDEHALVDRGAEHCQTPGHTFGFEETRREYGPHIRIASPHWRVQPVLLIAPSDTAGTTCTVFRFSDKKWEDWACTSLQPYICESG